MCDSSAICRPADRDPKPILFIDEIHLLPGAGSAGGSMDAANALKPALARGATTIRKYRQTIEKHGARLVRDRRTRPLVRPYGRCACVAIETNMNRYAHLRSPSHFTHGGSQGGARPPGPTAAVEWSIRYLPVFRLPDKALDLVDKACAVVRFRTLAPHAEKSGGETRPQRTGARRSSHGEDMRPAARCRSHVRVELDESAEELILRKGFSEEFGTRNLERVMDRMSGSLIAEALLGGEIRKGQTIRLEASDGQIQLCRFPSH